MRVFSRLAARLSSLLLPIFLFSSAATAGVVLFDQGHGQRFVIERDGELELSQLAALARELGHQVASTQGRLDEQLLEQADLLVISGAFAPFSDDERQAIVQFLRQGGALLMTLHVGPLNAQLLYDLGLRVSNGVVLDEERMIEGRPTDFVATVAGENPLTRGLNDFRVYGSWALLPGEGMETLLLSGNGSWADLRRNRLADPDEPRGPFVVGVVDERPGHRLVVLGDDAVFQNRFLYGDNRLLAARILRTLGERKNAE